MDDEAKAFLMKLVETPSPSGYEQAVQKLVRARIQPWCDEVKTDVMGNVFGILNPAGKPRIMLAGHCDQIGFIVQYISDEGFLYIDTIGGVDPIVATSQRVTIMSKSGPILGVIGRKPIHLMDEEDRKKVPKIHDLYIDIGAASQEEALRLVSTGDAGVFQQPYVELVNRRIASMAFDNKMGTWIVTEVLRLLHERKRDACIVGVSTVQEEIGLRGAQTSAFAAEADVGIALDVCHSTDTPGVEKKKSGAHCLGKGPVIFRGANINPKVFELLISAAESHSIPFQIASSARGSRTDAGVMQTSRAGLATGLLGVPLRYMHTPNEVLSLDDLEHTVNLLATFCANLNRDQDFTP